MEVCSESEQIERRLKELERYGIDLCLVGNMKMVVVLSVLATSLLRGSNIVYPTPSSLEVKGLPIVHFPIPSAPIPPQRQEPIILNRA